MGAGFAQCVKDLALETKETLENKIESDEADGRIPKKWEVDYVNNVDCLTDLLIFLEPLWGPFFAEAFRDIRKLLREFEARQRAMLAFAQKLTLSLEFDRFQKLEDQLKRFTDQLEQVEAEYEDCPPAQLLIEFMTFVRTFVQIRKLGTQAQEFFERLTDPADTRSLRLRLQRAAAAEFLSAEGDTTQVLAAWAILVANIYPFTSGSIDVTTPEGNRQLWSTLIGSITTIGFLIKTEGDDGQSIADQIQASLSFMRVVSNCLTVSEFNFFSDEFVSTLDVQIGPGTDFRFPPDDDANFEDEDAARAAIPGPNPPNFRLFPPL